MFGKDKNEEIIREIKAFKEAVERVEKKVDILLGLSQSPFQDKKKMMIELKNQGLSYSQIAKRLGVSRQYVQRILSEMAK